MNHQLRQIITGGSLDKFLQNLWDFVKKHVKLFIVVDDNDQPMISEIEAGFDDLSSFV